jgi:seryl-tRNA synthetase
MLNATLCATGRGICCILENYQAENGVVVPDVLRPYMGGRDFLEFVRGPPEITKGEKGKKKN